MKKVLIIDADTTLLSTLSNELSQAGYYVVTQTSGHDGLSHASDAALVITAVELPDMNGFVVCSTLKRNPQTANIPIFITSSAETTDAFEQHLTLTNHADGYFLKPLDVATMLQEMDAIFAELDAMMPAEEMIDMVQEEGEPGEDSEVIKALALDDMSLFEDIDAGIEEPADHVFDEDVQMDIAPEPVSAPAPAPAPVAAKPSIPGMPASIPGKPAGLPKPGLLGKLPPKPGLPPRTLGAPVASASAPAPSPVGAHTPAAAPAPAASPAVPSLTSAPAATLSPAVSSATPSLTPAPAAHVSTPSPVKSPTGSFPRANLGTGLSGSRNLPSSDNKAVSVSASFTAISQSALSAADTSRLNDEITVLRNEITALKSEITAKDNRITMLQSQCDALTARCQNAESITEQLNAETNNIGAQLDEYAAIDAEKTAQLEAYIAADAEKNAQIEAFIAADAEKTAQIEALMNAMAQKNEQLAALAQQLLSLSQD